MKFSEQWLREWVNPKVDTKTLAEQLTMAGLEVEEITPVANDFKGVVIGWVKTAEQHPNADRLRVCQVDVGTDELLTIVCGGANVRTNLKVPVAVVGAVLSDNFVIKPSKLRGILSQGMICSAQELGLNTEGYSEGILELDDDAPIGKDFRDYLQLDDHVLHVNLTPNRGDCLSVFGVAREVAAINDHKMPVMAKEKNETTSAKSFPVQVLAPEDCAQYVGRVIENSDLQTKTPIEIKERLRRSGLRSINLVVDITNYVLLEIGQPLHAFDLDKLKGSISVRRAFSSESLTLLDSRVISLNPETLIIADEQGPLALAGIMGGLDSSITAETQHIFLESAFFNPAVMSGQARKYGLSTDASHRFERFVSPELQIQAIEQATQLLLGIAGGDAGPLIQIQADQSLPKVATITLRKAQIARLLGIELSDEKVTNLLQRLNMQVTAISPLPPVGEGAGVREAGWQVQVPLYRFDLKTEADLIEEIARIYGYDHISSSTHSVSAKVRSGAKEAERPVVATPDLIRGKRSRPNEIASLGSAEFAMTTSTIQNFFSQRGYQEVINYSFIDLKLHRLISPNAKPIQLENPISSELSVMRASLWPGLLQATINNQNHRQQRLRFFETGLCFYQSESGLLQRPFLAGVLTGTRYPEQWASTKEPIDFFDVKADVGNLFHAFGQSDDLVFKTGEHPALHPGQTAQIELNNQIVGYVGALHPECLEKLELEGPVYLFELALDAFSKKPRFYQSFSKYPSVRRDIALLVNQEVSAADLLRTIESTGGKLLQQAWVFDLYQGKGIEENQKSIAIGLLWQHPERTLLDEEIAQKMEQIINKLQNDFNAVLRA